MHDQPATTQDETHAHYNPDPHAHPGLRVIAVFEAGKGLLAWIAASGLALIGPKPLQHWVHLLIARFQADPDRGAMSWLANAIGIPAPCTWPRRSPRSTARCTSSKAGACGGRRPGPRGSGCVTAALYLPFDIYAYARHRHWMEAVVVAVNLLVVWVLAATCSSASVSRARQHNAIGAASPRPAVPG